jgi:hypothetical protein
MIRLRVGEIEVEYDRADGFPENELRRLIELAGGLPRARDTGGGSGPAIVAPASPAQPAPAVHVGTTNNIAARLGVSDGAGLIVAAAAYFTFGQGKDRFNRLELLAEMKGATSYYRATYSGNLGKYLQTLIRSKRLSEIGKGTYALPAQIRDELRAKLIG